jgi:DNA-binding response OmpR family regulator
MSRIMVVDDDPNLRDLVAIRLQKAGHKVLTAGSAGEALAIVDQRGAPDVVVLDVLMPGMTGFELLPALRSIHGMEELPAIFLSGRVEEHHIRAGRAMGAAYLTKPFSANALTKTIAKLSQREVAVAPAGW